VSHTKGITQGHNTSAEEEERTYRAVAYVPTGQGTRSLWVMGELLTYKIPSRWTGGAYSLFEVATQPGAGPPPHVNHREDESFYVLEGEYEFLIEGITIRARAGSLIYVPKGTLHAHNGVGEGKGRMLVTQTPGGLYERFFEELGNEADGDDAEPPVLDERSGAKKIVAVAAQHGIEILPPNPKEP
jgi:quercetin dioxygenase-like cupin family protein